MRCCSCKLDKINEEFYKDSSRGTGFSSRCKPCTRHIFTGKRSIKGQLKHRLISNVRRRVKDVLSGYRASNSDVGCTTDELISHLESKFTSGMSWDNYGSVWHIDHVRPISNFLKTGEDPRKANHFTNLAPLFASDNLRKGAKF